MRDLLAPWIGAIRTWDHTSWPGLLMSQSLCMMGLALFRAGNFKRHTQLKLVLIINLPLIFLKLRHLLQLSYEMLELVFGGMGVEVLATAVVRL